MAIEHTANRDCKTKGGIVGFTLNRGYLYSWPSQPEQSAIARKCEELAGITENDRYKQIIFKIEFEFNVFIFERLPMLYLFIRDRKNLDETSKQRHEFNVVNVVETIKRQCMIPLSILKTTWSTFPMELSKKTQHQVICYRLIKLEQLIITGFYRRICYLMTLICSVLSKRTVSKHLYRQNKR